MSAGGVALAEEPSPVSTGRKAFPGDSPVARRIAGLVPRLSNAATTVLLLGESGTGKSFLARSLHVSGCRASQPFRVVNCAAIPETLIESELFGHERGAYTGATGTRIGAFESAGEGTIFLDEIAELPLASQAKLLRALEERKFERLGSNHSLAMRARVIAATNRDLHEMVGARRFREDLYFRVSVVSVELPALRQRREDFDLLAREVLSELASSLGRRADGFAADALEAMRSYAWPGNLRELRNVLEAALVLGDGTRITCEDVLPTLRDKTRRSSNVDDVFVVQLPADLASLEARAIDVALKVTGGNRTRAAALLGISRVTLYKKLARGARP